MKTKFNLDREPLESDYIHSKRDFNKVVKGYKASQYPVWKRPWFYGPTGAAAFALILSMTIFNENELNDPKTTLTASVTENQDLKDTPCVHPPSEENDLAFQVYTLEAEGETQLQLPSGTTIKIPSGSLLTKGEVRLEVREFANKSEVFLAGVPMDYQSEAFESAGMIEMRAYQNGELVAIDSQKPIEVSMVQTKTGPDFGFWYLNETEGKWLAHPSNQVTETRNLELEETACVQHINKVNEQLVEVDEKVKLVNQPDEKQQLLPSPNAKKMMVDFDIADFPEFKSLKGVEFEYLKYTPELSAKLKNGTWTKMELQKSSTYIVEFSNSRERISVPVKPVLSGSELAQLQARLAEAEKLKKLELSKLAAEKKRLEKEQRLLQIKLEKLQAEMKTALAKQSNTASEREKYANRQASRNTVNTVTRSQFATTRWGLYNCDQPVPYPKPFLEPREFVDKNDAKINVQNAYVFDLKKDVRYTFGIGSRALEEIGWNRSNTTLIVLDDHGRMYVAQKVNELDSRSRVIRFQELDLANLDAEQLEKILNEEMVLA